MRILISVLTALLLLQPLNALAADSATDTKIKAAIAADIRSEADKARDANRKPLETLQFFGLKEDMKVLELLPGGGWYTKILAPVLYEKGKLYVSIGTQGLEANLIGQPGFDRIEVIQPEGAFNRVGRRFEGVSFKANDLDMVLTFRNLHNMTDAGRASLNKDSFNALKPGGLYGVVDHTRRHMQSESDENWRRMDPVLMIKEIEAAGFEFVDTSSLHYRADDELIYEVGRKTVTGNTDRFTLLFRKPE
ncbi:MAG: methyltransferase [Proteobacteria bacterium]|nr:methyltransferase [Pseudomonadota bacterium]